MCRWTDAHSKGVQIRPIDTEFVEHVVRQRANHRREENLRVAPLAQRLGLHDMQEPISVPRVPLQSLKATVRRRI